MRDSVGTWIGVGLAALLVGMVGTLVLFEVPSPWDWMIPIALFLLTLFYGVRRYSTGTPGR